jgi:DNA replication protein DnaC
VHARIPPNYRTASFDNFELPSHDLVARRLEHVLRELKNYVREFPEGEKPGVLLSGDVGTGKTHVAVAVVSRALMAKGFEVIFCDHQGLFEQIRTGYDRASGASDREAYHPALEAEVLLLDDLGAHRHNETEPRSAN